MTQVAQVNKTLNRICCDPIFWTLWFRHNSDPIELPQTNRVCFRDIASLLSQASLTQLFTNSKLLFKGIEKIIGLYTSLNLLSKLDNCLIQRYFFDQVANDHHLRAYHLAKVIDLSNLSDLKYISPRSFWYIETSPTGIMMIAEALSRKTIEEYDMIVSRFLVPCLSRKSEYQHESYLKFIETVATFAHYNGNNLLAEELSRIFQIHHSNALKQIDEGIFPRSYHDDMDIISWYIGSHGKYDVILTPKGTRRHDHLVTMIIAAMIHGQKDFIVKILTLDECKVNVNYFWGNIPIEYLTDVDPDILRILMKFHSWMDYDIEKEIRKNLSSGRLDSIRYLDKKIPNYKF